MMKGVGSGCIQQGGMRDRRLTTKFWRREGGQGEEGGMKGMVMSDDRGFGGDRKRKGV